MLRQFSLAMVLACTTLPAFAHDYAAGDLMIKHPWSRELPPNAPAGAAFFTIENHGADDRLIGASSPIAGKSELHTHVHENGMMKMTHIPAIELPMHGSSLFQPGGNHVMLFELNKPLVAGESFPLTLEFEKAGKVEVEVKVESSDYMPADTSSMPTMTHDAGMHGEMKHPD